MDLRSLTRFARSPTPTGSVSTPPKSSAANPKANPARSSRESARCSKRFDAGVVSALGLCLKVQPQTATAFRRRHSLARLTLRRGRLHFRPIVSCRRAETARLASHPLGIMNGTGTSHQPALCRSINFAVIRWFACSWSTFSAGTRRLRSSRRCFAITTPAFSYADTIMPQFFCGGIFVPPDVSRRVEKDGRAAAIRHAFTRNIGLILVGLAQYGSCETKD